MNDKTPEKPTATPDSVASGAKACEPVSEGPFHTEAVNRILHSLLLAFFAWLAIWVFAIVMLVQWGFMIFTGEANQNLKGFMSEVGQYITQVLRYLALQTDEKPFPFSSWPHPVPDPSKHGKDNASTTPSV